jgi:hypothetical protein
MIRIRSPGRAAMVQVLMVFTDTGWSNRFCRARIVFRGRKVAFMRCGSPYDTSLILRICCWQPCSYRDCNHRSTCDAV